MLSQGLNAALFYDNPDPRSYVSLVPTSAITGEGMGNLLALIVQSCQTMLAKRLMFSEELQVTIINISEYWLTEEFCSNISFRKKNCIIK